MSFMFGWRRELAAVQISLLAKSLPADGATESLNSRENLLRRGPDQLQLQHHCVWEGPAVGEPERHHRSNGSICGALDQLEFLASDLRQADRFRLPTATVKSW